MEQWRLSPGVGPPQDECHHKVERATRAYYGVRQMDEEARADKRTARDEDGIFF